MPGRAALKFLRSPEQVLQGGALARLIGFHRLSDCTEEVRRSLVLYALGDGSDARHWYAVADAIARQLPEDMTVGVVRHEELPEAGTLFRLKRWDEVVYVAGGRPVLSWPLAMGDELAAFMDGKVAPRKVSGD